MTRHINRNGLEFEDGDDPSHEQVELCTEFLERFCRRDAEQSVGSYELKGLIEDWSDEYVSNGALIKAADELGYDYEPSPPNARIHLDGSDYCKMKRREADTEQLYRLLKQLHGDLETTLRNLDDLMRVRRNDGDPEEIRDIPDALRRMADEIESRTTEKRL